MRAPFKISPASTSLMALFAMWVPATSGQSVYVRLIDQKTGVPIARKILHVVAEPTMKELSIIPVGNAYLIEMGNGDISRLRLTNNQNDSWAAYVNCWNESEQFSASVGEIFAKGVVSENHCSNRVATAKPGEVVIFVRHLPWWKKLD